MNFICFDGETKDNKYTLLGNNYNYIYDEKGLSSEACFNWLWNEMQPKLKYVIFRIEFDINFWVKDFNTNQKIRLFNSLLVEWNGYTLRYFRNKFLEIRKGNKKKIIYDIYSFFNKSFLSVIDLLNVPLTVLEKEILELGKKHRVTNFTKMNLRQIILYNKTECIIASKMCDIIYMLMRKAYFYNQHSKKKDFYTPSFYGSSAIANKFLNNFNLASSNFILMFTDKKIITAIKKAYFGGRMESLKVGTFKNLFKYDINSAYPSVINELREIKKIYLKEFDNKPITKTNLYYISMEIYDLEMIGLLPVRHKSGMLFFPKKVKGWYYGCEVIQIINYAKKYFLDYKILKEICFELGNKIFNSEIKTIYNQRLLLKKLNNIQHYIYKIMLNSTYGKFAQKVGTAKHQNFYYAGYITSVTRAKLLEAVINNPNEVVFFATDGILTKTKLKLPINNKLGNWEEIKIKKAQIILSGVYKLLDYNNVVYLGERGFRFDFDKVFSDIIKVGYSEVKTSLFITFKYGHKNHIKYGKDICKFVSLIKNITPNSNIKRFFHSYKMDRENTSLLIDMNELSKMKDLKIDFTNDREIYK